MTRSLVILVVIVISSVNLSKGDQCKGPLNNGLKYGQICQKHLEEACKKANGKPLSKSFMTNSLACLDKHLFPCIKSGAPAINSLVDKCVKNKNILTAENLCSSTKQTEVIDCCKAGFEKDKKNIMKQVGSICGTLKDFEGCFGSEVKKMK